MLRQKFLDDLKKLQRSLIDNGSRLLAEGRLADLIRSVSVFGFHMMPLDLRQHAGKHADVVAELFQHAGLEDYNSLNEEQKQAALLRELATNVRCTARSSHTATIPAANWRFSTKRAKSKTNSAKMP